MLVYYTRLFWAVSRCSQITIPRDSRRRDGASREWQAGDRNPGEPLGEARWPLRDGDDPLRCFRAAINLTKGAAGEQPVCCLGGWPPIAKPRGDETFRQAWRKEINGIGNLIYLSCQGAVLLHEALQAAVELFSKRRVRRRSWPDARERRALTLNWLSAAKDNDLGGGDGGEGEQEVGEGGCGLKKGEEKMCVGEVKSSNQ